MILMSNHMILWRNKQSISTCWLKKKKKKNMANFTDQEKWIKTDKNIPYILIKSRNTHVFY